MKYYKGLGTSTAAEARDYFSDLATHQLDFDLLREGDGDLVDMAFSKKRVEDRKTWLRSLEPGAFVDYGVDALAYKVSDSASFPNVSELQVASTASSRCRTALTPSTRPSESLRVSRGSRGCVATLSFEHRSAPTS